MRPLIGTLKSEDYADIGDGVFVAQHAAEYLRTQGARIEIPTEHRWWEYGTAIQMLLNQYGKDKMPELSVLDVGSGWGAFGPALAYTYGTQVTEVEPGSERNDREVLNRALVAAGKPAITVLNATTDNLPDEQYDMVACISVIEHMPATIEERCWQQLVNRIKPGGLFFVDVDCVPDPTKAYLFDNLRAHNFTCEEMKERVERLKTMGMEPIGVPDYAYHGDMVHDNFTFFRIGMRKKV